MRRLIGSGVAVCGALAALWACSDGPPPPAGSGNVVIVDVDATRSPPPPDNDADDDSPFAPLDGGYAYLGDAYDPLGNCASCACPATDYCFGGGTGYTAFACTPSGFGAGCQPIPAACAGDASCDCLLQATSAQISCVGVCVQNPTQGGGPVVYCPHP